MSIRKTLVSYNSLVTPFGGTGDLLARTQQAARKAIPDSNRADARTAQVATGLTQLQTAQGAYPQIIHTPRDTTAALLQSHVARQAIHENKLEAFILKSVNFVLEGLNVKFSSDDWIGWMTSFFTWIEGIDPAVCPKPAPVATPIPNTFRMAVIGDWGTGLYGAPTCAESIQNDTDGYDFLLHLGDVYYSGLEEEVEDRFLALWPKVPTAISRSLNGNHEMYTGGHGYFENLLPGLNQPSSYFALQNDFWTFIALDTAYNQTFGGQEGNLFQDQADWIDAIISAAGNRKIVLFSHHQPYSLLDTNQGPLLVKWLQKYLDAKRIYAWYWGHEHRCVLYDRHPQFGLSGRCVGHGGFPEARTDLSNAPASPRFGSQWRQLASRNGVPGAWVLDSPNVYIPGFETKFGPNGFMRLEFNNGDLTEYVRSPMNANLYIEAL